MAEEYRKYAIPHPLWKDFPNNLPPHTRIDRMSRDRIPIIPDSSLTIQEFTIPARDKYPVRLRTYTRKNATQLPVFVYMHGGGYVTGSLETDDKSCRAIAKNMKVVVVSIEYRLAPEHPFPMGWDDCWDALKWIVTEEAKRKLNLDLGKGFVLGGTSAGANFTAGLAWRYLSEKLSPKITALNFWAGSWLHPDVRPPAWKPYILSVDEIDDAPGLTKNSIEIFRKKYGAPKDDLRYSPLLHESWKGIAEKCYFSICGWDPRRDEAIFFAKRLREQGLQVHEKIYTGLDHGFWTTCPEVEVSVEWERDMLEGLKWLLEK